MALFLQVPAALMTRSKDSTVYYRISIAGADALNDMMIFFESCVC